MLHDHCNFKRTHLHSGKFQLIMNNRFGLDCCFLLFSHAFAQGWWAIADVRMWSQLPQYVWANRRFFHRYQASTQSQIGWRLPNENDIDQTPMQQQWFGGEPLNVLHRSVSGVRYQNRHSPIRATYSRLVMQSESPLKQKRKGLESGAKPWQRHSFSLARLLFQPLLTPRLFTLSSAFRLIAGRLRADFAPRPDIAFVPASDAIVDGNLW